MAKRPTKTATLTVWALLRDPEATTEAVRAGKLDDRLTALADAAARWSVSGVRKACWTRMVQLEEAKAEGPADG